MLVTSRETGRWVIPKGWAIKGLKPADVAEREAYEEAGLVGHIIVSKKADRFFPLCRSCFRVGRLLCEVSVFLLLRASSGRGLARKGAEADRVVRPHRRAASLVHEEE